MKAETKKNLAGVILLFMCFAAIPIFIGKMLENRQGTEVNETPDIGVRANPPGVESEDDGEEVNPDQTD